MLFVSPQIDAHNFAVFYILHESADSVGKIFFIDTAGARAASFRENHDGVPVAKEIDAGFENLLHLLSGAAPINGNALGQIAQNRQKNVTLKIAPFRQIPRQLFILRKVPAETEGGVTQQKGINHG